MEYCEAPSIQQISRKLLFPAIKWLTKEKFEECVNKNQDIHPHLDPMEADSSSKSSANRLYIGKTIQNNINEGVRFAYRSDNRQINLEIIGTVSKSLDNQWHLSVPHASTVFEIKKDFLVLSIEDPDSFEWIKTIGDDIPKYALRGCIDINTNEYFYIGKTSQDTEMPEYYQNFVWNKFRESTLPKLFGKIHPTHKCFYAPFNKLELSFSTYDILCLKPSPANLKILARLEIRNILNHSNENMSLINRNKSGRKYVPEGLVNFIKYPAYLTVGEYMLRGEKLVREDGKFEMLIESDGSLVTRSIIKNRDSLSKEELIELENVQIKRKIDYNVSSIWLHRFQVAFYNADRRVFVKHNFYNKSPEYKFTIDDTDTPSYTVTEIIE